jgi:serine/threonine protein kinase
VRLLLIYFCSFVGLSHLLFASFRLLVSEVMFQGLLDEFRAEVSALANLNHPHIVQMYGISVHKNSVYICTEFCPNNLRELLDAEDFGGEPRRGQTMGRRLVTTLDHHEGMEVAQQTASAIQFIHFKNMSHRDIKPENILMADFGIGPRKDINVKV